MAVSRLRSDSAPVARDGCESDSEPITTAAIIANTATALSHITARLRELRESRGLSQEQLADLVAIEGAERTVPLLEEGTERVLWGDDAVALAFAYGLTLEQLLGVLYGFQPVE